MTNQHEPAGDPPYDDIVDDAEVVDDEPERVAVPRQRNKIRKRGKKKRIDVHAEDEKFRRSVMWFMLGLGIILCFGGAVSIAGRAFAFRAIGQMVLYLIVIIPICVGALMAVGMFVGIDYGEYKSAILKLTAIAFMNNGVLWVVDGAGAHFLITLPTCMLVCYGLFMVLYDLDFWETWISVTAVQVVEFGAKMILVLAIVASERHKDKKRKIEDPEPPNAGTRIEVPTIARIDHQQANHE